MDTITEGICNDILEVTSKDVEEINYIKDEIDTLTNDGLRTKLKNIVEEELVSIQGLRDQTLKDLENGYESNIEFNDTLCSESEDELTENMVEINN